MSKRVSKYQKQLEILRDKCKPMEGLLPISYKLHLLEMAMTVLEVRKSLNELLDRLNEGDPLMDDCIDIDMWEIKEYYDQNIKKDENIDVEQYVMTALNYMQDLCYDDNMSLRDGSKRSAVVTALCQLTTENILTIEELLGVIWNGMGEICELILEIDNKKIDDYTDISYEYLYKRFHTLSVQSLLHERPSNVGKFRSWQLKTSPSLETLIDKRNEYIENLLNSEFCKVCDEYTPPLDEVLKKYPELSDDNSRLSKLGDNIKRRYGRFRQMFNMKGNCYCLTTESELGKYIHANREFLQDEEICEFLMWKDVISVIQKEISNKSADSVEPWVDSLLKYVAPLKEHYNGKDFDGLWNELICNNENIHKNDGKRKVPLKLFACRTKVEENDNSKFDKVVVQNIVGYMKQEEIISGSTNKEVALYLETDDKEVGKCEMQIMYGLNNTTLDEQNLTKLKEIIGKHKRN